MKFSEMTYTRPDADGRFRLEGLPDGPSTLVYWHPRGRAYSEILVLPTPQPREPGPFALGEQDYVTDLLRSAGFSNISFDAWTGDQRVGGPGSDPESATRFVLDGMQVGDLVRASGNDTRVAVHRSLVQLFERNCDDEGVRMGAKAWLVSARA